MLRVKQIINEHIQQKYTTNQQATTEYVQRRQRCCSFLHQSERKCSKKGLDWFRSGPALPKKVHSPFILFTLPTCFLIVQTWIEADFLFFTLLIFYDSFKKIFILIFTASLWLLYILSWNPLPNILHVCETIGAVFFLQNRSHMQEGWHGNIQSV